MVKNIVIASDDQTRLLLHPQQFGEIGDGECVFSPAHTTTRTPESRLPGDILMSSPELKIITG